MKNAVSANASALPDRRLFLSFGAAAAVTNAVKNPAHAAEGSPMAAMIDRYRAARQAFYEMCEIEDNTPSSAPEYAVVEARCSEALDVEDASMLDLLRHRPANLSEATMRAEYLLSANLFAEFREEHFVAICQSFSAI
jgi:hypothetical protein